MIKFTFEMEDVKGSLVRLENGNYLLSAREGEGQESIKEIASIEAAALLFASFDETDFESLGTVFLVAAEAQRNFKVQLIP